MEMEREKRSVCVPMTLCKPDWSPYRVGKRSNKRTPLLAALLLVYKSLASNKKVAFRKPSALWRSEITDRELQNDQFKPSGKFLGSISRLFLRKLGNICEKCHFLQSKVYRGVIEDVIKNVRESFLNEGVDEQVLQELKQVTVSLISQG